MLVCLVSVFFFGIGSATCRPRMRIKTFLHGNGHFEVLRRTSFERNQSLPNTNDELVYECFIPMPVDHLIGCNARPYSPHCAATKVLSSCLLVISQAAMQDPTHPTGHFAVSRRTSFEKHQILHNTNDELVNGSFIAMPVGHLIGCNARPYSSHCAATKVSSSCLLIIS